MLSLQVQREAAKPSEEDIMLGVGNEADRIQRRNLLAAHTL
jgi:hypothetical protein